jgi:DNA (cytosine-5)-methyltransferase 1
VSAYYNEIDHYAAQWLRNLIAGGHIAPGVVDARDIRQVLPSEISGYTQCHFFAGIAGWSLALRLAGWPDDRPVWTGSCPCQPFSVAHTSHRGAEGQGDERDLWPSMFRLIKECQPPVVFGEQVPNAIAWGWWDRAALDLEAEAYACAALVLRADAYGAPHQRKRLYWLAHANGKGLARCSEEVVPGVHEARQPIYGNPFAKSRSALAGDYGDLLPCDGVSPSMEHGATKGYGNAIVPQVAAEFIKATL